MAGIKRCQGENFNTNTIAYDLDTEADIAFLPSFNNGVRVPGSAEWCKNDLPPIGSSAWVIGAENNSWSYWELGTNGWKKIVSAPTNS